MKIFTLSLLIIFISMPSYYFSMDVKDVEQFQEFFNKAMNKGFDGKSDF